AYWIMDGGTFTGFGGYFGGAVNPGPAWRLVGAGDFENSGFADDLAWQYSDGAVGYWIMNGGTFSYGSYFANHDNPGSAYRLIATGDFTCAGRLDDLVFQAADGTPGIWSMDGARFAYGSYLRR